MLPQGYNKVKQNYTTLISVCHHYLSRNVNQLSQSRFVRACVHNLHDEHNAIYLWTNFWSERINMSQLLPG